MHFLFRNNSYLSNVHELRKNMSFLALCLSKLKKKSFIYSFINLGHIISLQIESQTNCCFEKWGSMNSFSNKFSLNDQNQSKNAFFPGMLKFDVAKITFCISNVITSSVTVSYALKS